MRDGDRQCTQTVYAWTLHATKAYKGAEVHLCRCYLRHPMGWIPRLGSLIPGEWVGPRAGMGAILPPPVIELRFLGCPPRSLVVTPTTLSRPWTLIIPDNEEGSVHKFRKLSPINHKKLNTVRNLMGTRGGVVRWGTTLQAGRSRVRFLMVPGIFHWHNPPGRTMPLGSTLSLTEMSTRKPARWADNLTTFMCRLSRNL